ncbi:MAG: hypothetical protein MRY21_05975 [Simkaniaceae bacterium]|nr:hypothetical protein [Simkaniaceae bacterium]
MQSRAPLRALGVLLPAFMLTSLWLHRPLGIVLGVALAYLIAFLFALSCLSRFFYTLVTLLVASYAISILKSALMGNFVPYELFLASGILSLVGVSLIFPAWLIFLGADYLICSGISRE